MTIRTGITARVWCLGAVSTAFMLTTTVAHSADLNMMISDVDGKGAIITELAKRYQEENPDFSITMNSVGYNVIREQLPIQLEAGSGPDLAFITDTGGLHEYYVDLTPYVDAAAWEENYGAVLPWYRAGNPGGIYAFHSEMTITGPYVNLTMFEEAGVDIPEPGATWEDWAAATKAVMEATDSYAGMVMDRSGHRMAGPAMSYGAAYFDGDGKLMVDDGYKAFAQLMIDWHAEGIMPPDIWPAVSGSKYANGNEMFFNQDVPFYMSGSWNLGNVQTNVGDSFDWAVVPVPCGPAGCGVMPGGSGLVAFKSGDPEREEAAAKFVAWMGSDEIAAEFYTRTFAIPAHSKLQEQGLDYGSAGAGDSVSDGLVAFAGMAGVAAQQTPQAYQLQGSADNFKIFNSTTQYLAAAMNGELTLDEAIAKIEEEVSQ